MSEVVSTPFKKPKCGDMFPLGGKATVTLLRDVLGGLVNLQIVGTDPDIVQPVDGSTMTENYCPGDGVSAVTGGPRVNPDGTFFLIPETAGVFVVVLADGTQFTITAVQSAAYLGQPYPARILCVLMAGTTGTFSVGY